MDRNDNEHVYETSKPTHETKTNKYDKTKTKHAGEKPYSNTKNNNTYIKQTCIQMHVTTADTHKKKQYTDENISNVQTKQNSHTKNPNMIMKQRNTYAYEKISCKRT